MTGRRRLAGSRARGAVLALIAAAFVLGFGIGRWSAESEPGLPASAPEVSEPRAPVAVAVPASPRPETSAPRTVGEPSANPGSTGPRIAIVIDDLGRSVAMVDELRSLGVPLTYAVLPFESRTPEVVAYLFSLGLEMLCHVPMEAQRNVDPGPGALRRSMSGAEIRSTTARALAAVPDAVGVNNHMGSAFSEDSGSMAPFLEVVAGHGLFFLDSRTSADTQGMIVASRLGMRAVERNVFLDRDRTRGRIRNEFRRALALSSGGTPAVAIGHPYDETLEVLSEEIPRALEQGFVFVTVAELVASEPGRAK